MNVLSIAPSDKSNTPTDLLLIEKITQIRDLLRKLRCSLSRTAEKKDICLYINSPGASVCSEVVFYYPDGRSAEFFD